MIPTLVRLSPVLRVEVGRLREIWPPGREVRKSGSRETPRSRVRVHHGCFKPGRPAPRATHAAAKASAPAELPVRPLRSSASLPCGTLMLGYTSESERKCEKKWPDRAAMRHRRRRDVMESLQNQRFPANFGSGLAIPAEPATYTARGATGCCQLRRALVDTVRRVPASVGKIGGKVWQTKNC